METINEMLNDCDLRSLIREARSIVSQRDSVTDDAASGVANPTVTEIVAYAAESCFSREDCDSDESYIVGLLADLIEDRATAAEAASDAAETEAERATAQRKTEAAEAVVAATRGRAKITNDGYDGFGSIYLSFRGLKIRVADHAQAVGGGYNLNTGDRHGEAEVDFRIDAADCEIPSRDEIRRELADALRAAA